MQRIQIHQKNPQARHLKAAAEVLGNGGLLIYPTDSVYGLGCDLFNKSAVEKIYQNSFDNRIVAQVCNRGRDMAHSVSIRTDFIVNNRTVNAYTNLQLLGNQCTDNVSARFCTSLPVSTRNFLSFCKYPWAQMESFHKIHNVLLKHTISTPRTEPLF